MPGTQFLTFCNIGKETTRGTPVAPTRMLFADGTGVLDINDGLTFHEGENSGVRTRIRRATATKEDVNLAIRIPDVSFDDLVIPFSQLKGGVTGTGAGADKTWAFSPSMTAANNPEAFSLDVGDDIQNWRVQYGMATQFKLSSAIGQVTSLDMTMFGQRAIKTAKATPALNSGVKVYSGLWTVKFASAISGLTGASVNSNFLIDWDLEVNTGLTWRHYMDANNYGGQHVETDISATLNMTVESTALAVSQFVDKARAQTLDFIRLKNTGPALGGSAYSCQIDLPVLYEVPQVISAEDSGVNLYKVTARLAYDPTSAASIAISLVNSLATLP